MIKTIADQYLAQNAGRRYPLADDTSYDDVPSDTAILDFRCTVRGVPPGVVPVARLTNVLATPFGYGLIVSVERPGHVDTLQFVLPLNIPSNSPYTALAVNAPAGVSGVIVVSAAALRISGGAKNALFAATTVVCDSLKVDSLQSAQDADEAIDETDPDGTDATAALDGEIVLAEGRNAEPYLDGNRLRLDIRKGAGLGERCQSVSTGQTCDNVLFSINGERPGSDGELRIVGEDGITVTPRPEAHAVEVRIDDAALKRMSSDCRSTCKGG